jgi:hypothetical protein
MSFSDYLENKLIAHTYGGAAFTQPTAWWVKLHTGDPGEAGTSNAAAETTRKQVTSWTVSTNTATSASSVSWTSYPATETVTHVSVWDASSAGNCLGSGAVSPTVSMTGPGSNTLSIASGGITIALD